MQAPHAVSTCAPETTPQASRPVANTCFSPSPPCLLRAGGRGRPRVTYDVTAALNAARLCVFMADIYVEPEEEAVPAGRRPQELHRFLVHTSDGSRLASAAEKRWAAHHSGFCHMCQLSGTRFKYRSSSMSAFWAGLRLTAESARPAWSNMSPLPRTSPLQGCLPAVLQGDVPAGAGAAGRDAGAAQAAGRRRGARRQGPAAAAAGARRRRAAHRQPGQLEVEQLRLVAGGGRLWRRRAACLSAPRLSTIDCGRSSAADWLLGGEPTPRLAVGERSCGKQRIMPMRAARVLEDCRSMAGCGGM